MHEAFSKPEQISYVGDNCRTAGIGCMECKEILFKNMMEEIGPIQSRVKEMNQNPEYIIDVLKSGATRCTAIVKELMDEVREKIGVKSGWMKQ
jgi:tryptophanyl-tRNA synthetase